jgi:hypothetical protein
MACFEISRQSHPNTPVQFLILAQGGGTATDEETKQPQHHCQECGYLHQGLDRVLIIEFERREDEGEVASNPIRDLSYSFPFPQEPLQVNLVACIQHQVSHLPVYFLGLEKVYSYRLPV